MKAITTQADLESLISNAVEERLDLEYKRANSLQKTDGAKKEITKDVSSFANSAGGVLIYGIAEYDDVEKRHLPERIDPIDRTAFTREWLDQIIGNIRPRLDVVITPIALDSGSNDCAYVVQIPKGGTAYQAVDCRYYKRFNFRAEMMADHEIRDVMSRAEHPIIRPRFQIRLGTVFYSSGGLGQREQKRAPRPFFDVSVRNSGVRMAQFVTLWFKLPGAPLTDLPPNCTCTKGVFVEETGYQVYCISNRQRDITGWRPVLDFSAPTYSEPYFQPILPSLEMHLGSIEIEVKEFELLVRSEKSFEWKLQADNAPTASASTLVSDLPRFDEYNGAQE